MLALRIARRYLFSKKSHQAVNIISYISMGGVALATAAMVIVLSVFNGFKDFTAKRLSSIDPDLLVEPAQGKIIEDADSIADELFEFEGIAATHCVVQEKALAVCGDRQMAVTLRGEETEKGLLPSLEPYIIDGNAYVFTDRGVSFGVSSVGTANGLRPRSQFNEFIKLYEPKRIGRINPSNPMAAFTADSLLLAGVFRADNPEHDKDRLIVPIELARNLLEYENEASFIEITLDDGISVERAKEVVSRELGPKFIVKTRHEQQEQAFRMINIEKWITLLMLAFILIIASFNILSTLSMLIIEKRANMGILNAMGAPPSMAGRIFSALSFLISAIGGIIGIVLGIGLAIAQQYGGFIKLHASDLSVMAIESYPVRVNPWDILIVIGIIIVVGALTATVVRLSLKNRR